jgi:hypothetical protein
MSRSFGKKKEVVQDPTRIAVGAEVGTFLAPAAPDDVRVAVPLLHALPAEHYAPLMKAVYKYIQEGSLSENAFNAMQSAAEFENVDFGALLSGIYTLVTIITRMKTKLSVVAADLAKMNFPAPFIELLVKLLRSSRPGLERLALTRSSHLPRLLSLRWRVDVVISSSSLSREMKPIITMEVDYLHSLSMYYSVPRTSHPCLIFGDELCR